MQITRNAELLQELGVLTFDKLPVVCLDSDKYGSVNFSPGVDKLQCIVYNVYRTQKEATTMTLETAIKLLQQDLDDPGSVDILDLNHAQELSIEALKRIQDCRHDWNLTITTSLPGETKE